MSNRALQRVMQQRHAGARLRQASVDAGPVGPPRETQVIDLIPLQAAQSIIDCEIRPGAQSGPTDVIVIDDQIVPCLEIAHEDVEQCLAASFEKEQKQHHTIARSSHAYGRALTGRRPSRRYVAAVDGSGQQVGLQVRQTDREIPLAQQFVALAQRYVALAQQVVRFYADIELEAQVLVLAKDGFAARKFRRNRGELLSRRTGIGVDNVIDTALRGDPPTLKHNAAIAPFTEQL